MGAVGEMSRTFFGLQCPIIFIMSSWRLGGVECQGITYGQATTVVDVVKGVLG